MKWVQFTCCGSGVEAHLSPGEAEEQARVFKALGDPTRLLILDVLSQHPGEVCVCDLAASFPQNQPTISHHLRVLREAGLVYAQRRGTWMYYRPNRRRLEWARAQLGALARQPSAAVAS